MAEEKLNANDTLSKVLAYVDSPFKLFALILMAVLAFAGPSWLRTRQDVVSGVEVQESLLLTPTLPYSIQLAGVTLQAPALSGSEDFAFMLERVPGSYLLIGNGGPESAMAAHACMVHHPGYDFNDDNIAIGSAYWVLMARRFLQEFAS